jgi:3',5'-cyclic AMP phosphodiesterase CpdA
MKISRPTVAFACATAIACGNGVTGPTPAPTPAPPSTQNPIPATHVLVGAGDIGVCGSAGTEQTAALIDRIDGTVFTSGDNAYYQGTMNEYRNCYHPSWGRHKDRTRPAPGNHEYETARAAAYFEYYGPNAGPSGLGYYSFQAGNWHVVSLNSNVSADQASAQYDWLASDLAARNARCIAAIWHHPLFSSSQNGPSPMMRDAWRLLQQAGAELAVVGHEHAYERFAPLDSLGRPTPDGIRQFVVGTGGAPLYQFVMVAPGSEVRISAWGVLKLTLHPESYNWEFIAINGLVRDSGTGACR